jgi:hypothetical protein
MVRIPLRRCRVKTRPLRVEDLLIEEVNSSAEGDHGVSVEASATVECHHCRRRQKVSGAGSGGSEEVARSGAVSEYLQQLSDAGWLRVEEEGVTCPECHAVEWEADLRKKLSVPEDATVEEICNLIQAEGAAPHLIHVEKNGRILWACRRQRGESFFSIECDNQTGVMFQPCYPSQAIAALESLRAMRKVD